MYIVCVRWRACAGVLALTTPSTCSNNGSGQLCDCEAAPSGNSTPRCVIRVTVSSVCVHRNYNGPFGRTSFNEHLWHKISGHMSLIHIIANAVDVVRKQNPK